MLKIHHLCALGAIAMLLLIGLVVDWGVAALALVACGFVLGFCVFLDDDLYQKEVAKHRSNSA